VVTSIHRQMEKGFIDREQRLDMVLWNKLRNVHPYVVWNVSDPLDCVHPGLRLANGVRNVGHGERSPASRSFQP